MAGPVFRASGARATSAGATTLTPAKPTVDGQSGLLLAVLTTKNNATHSTSTTGWALVGTQTNSGASFTASLWSAAEGSAAPVFTWTGSVACSAQIAYYSDPANSMNIGSSVVGTPGTGTASPHTSAAITTDADNTLAIYVDVAAANTALTNPSGWTQDVSGGSATDAGRTTFGSKAIATSGSSSGANSSAGAAAAWVQWQLELKGSAAASALQASKLGTGAWLEPASGFDAAKLSTGAWLDLVSGGGFTKIEVGAWLDKGGRRRQLMAS